MLLSIFLLPVFLNKKSAVVSIDGTNKMNFYSAINKDYRKADYECNKDIE
jgi:hypothetical protein